MNKTMRPACPFCDERDKRIRELEELTDWVCIYCHQRNIGGTQCCPDWDGTTVNSRIRELEALAKLAYVRSDIRLDIEWLKRYRSAIGEGDGTND